MLRHCSSFIRHPFTYSLECTTNVGVMESWAIYRDFVALCRTAPIPEIQRFHDEHLLTYESRLRSVSPDLRFTDLNHYNPYDPESSKEQIEGDIYRRIMGTAYLAIRDPSQPDRVKEWFQRIAVENNPLK